MTLQFHNKKHYMYSKRYSQNSCLHVCVIVYNEGRRANLQTCGSLYTR